VSTALKTLLTPKIGERVAIALEASDIYGGRAGEVLEVTGGQAKIKIDGICRAYFIEIKHLEVIL